MSFVISATSLLVASGLNQDTGFDINRDLKAVISAYNNTTIIRKYAEVLNAMVSSGNDPKPAEIPASNPDEEPIPNPFSSIYSLGTSSFPLVVGTIPSSFLPTFPRQQLYEAVTNRALYILGNGDLSGFISAFNRSRGFVQSSELYMRSLQKANKKISSLGTGIFTDYSSLATAGFSALGSKEQLIKDFDALGNYGYFDFLDKLGSPAIVIGAIEKANLTKFMGLDVLLTAVKLDDVNLYDSKYENLLTSILNQISIPRNLLRFKDFYKMRFTPVNFNDLTDSNKIFPTSMSTNNFENLSELGQIFKKIGNFDRVESYKSIADLLRELDFVETARHINELKELITPDTINFISGLYGGGTGEYGDITLNDMIGSVAGVNCLQGFSDATTIHEIIDSTDIGDTLVNRLDILVNLFNGEYEAGYDEDSEQVNVPGYGVFADLKSAYDAILASCEQDIVNIKLDNNINTLVENAEQTYTAVASQILNEQNFEYRTGLPFSTFVGNDIQGITTFSSVLPSIGTEYQVKNYLTLCTSDNLYGDAVKTALAEGVNIEKIYDANVYQVGQSTIK